VTRLFSSKHALQIVPQQENHEDSNGCYSNCINVHNSSPLPSPPEFIRTGIIAEVAVDGMNHARLRDFVIAFLTYRGLGIMGRK
jgi:hypothetical protein